VETTNTVETSSVSTVAVTTLRSRKVRKLPYKELLSQGEALGLNLFGLPQGLAAELFLSARRSDANARGHVSRKAVKAAATAQA
jgi:hypothetical protein